jgi:predicted RND superfamily exporter protein
VAAKEGGDVFASEGGDDLEDLRTRRRDALALARAELGLEADEGTMEAPQQTERGQSVLFVYVARDGDNVFSEAGIRRMREIEDKITKDPDFPKFCLRADKSGGVACSAPLSPTRLFYAAGLNVAEIVTKVDALDGSTDGELSVFQMQNLTSILQELQRGAAAQMADKATSPSTSQPSNSSQGTSDIMQSLDVQQLVADIVSKTKMPYSDVMQAAALLQYLLPVMGALGGAMPVQDEMQDYQAVLRLASAMKSETFFKGLVDFYFDKGFESQKLRSKHTRAIVQFGEPLEGYKSKADRSKEQGEKLSSWFRDSFQSFLQGTSESGEVEVLYFATPLFFDEFIGILLRDMLFALISVAFVFICLWFHSRSLFLAIVGMMEILLTIPVAFVLYRVVFGFQYFAGLNAMTLFVVLAIGADDIFVLMDAYQQSLYHGPVCKDLRTRMTWVYRRATNAMFVTSFTTMAAFVASATSPLVDVQSFGIFAACAIFVDFILVITWFPACLVWYHNHLESRGCCCRRILKGTSTERGLSALEPGQVVTQQKRWIERFLGGPFAEFVVKRRRIILGCFVLLLTGAATAGAQIRAATSTDQFLPADHPFQRIFTITNEEFPSSAQDSNAKVQLAWGLKDVDRSGVNLLRDSDNKGNVVYDPSFSFDEAAQSHIFQTCMKVYQYGPEVSSFLSADLDAEFLAGKVECPLFDFKAWLDTQGKPFPVPMADVGSLMGEFLNSPVKGASDSSQNYQKKWQNAVGYSASHGKVLFLTVGVESTLRERARSTHATLKTQYDLFEGWLDKVNRDAPESANGAFHVAANSMWVWMHTQTVFVSSAVTGMVTGTILAFVVVLLATQQIVVAFASMLTILGVLASVLGAMVALGWELGTIESICLTILAGFSVDYVVHLAHAFVHAEQKERSDKVRSALDEIGVSVLAGMVTSASAAVALMVCQLQFFHKFGVFLILTVSISWIWANVGFLASMALLGPDDSTPLWLQFPASFVDHMRKRWKEKAKGTDQHKNGVAEENV